MLSAGGPRVWCSHKVQDDLCELAAEMAPLETGGCFAGYYARNSLDVVITDVIGPGPDAIHMRTRFISDRKFHDLVLANLWKRSKHIVRYVGDWHTHPQGSSNLSSVDKAFMKHALHSRYAYLKYSLVAIVHDDLTETKFWCLLPSCRRYGIFSSFIDLKVTSY